MVAEILLNSLIKVARKSDVKEQDFFMNAESVIREFRTVSLGLPRQTGKTTALIELYRSAPSLFVTRNAPMRSIMEDSGVSCHTIDELRQISHGKQLIVQYPLHYMLLDECLHVEAESKRHIFDVAADLWRRRQVDKERFVVVIVGT